ncbi:hypothetical protein [uncultured Thiodictyon sp.]|uniref:hypothetical protein n=1 Tax=uncultured Thiodictyon sp. TaxID=1846217 RepID=UPI0025EEA208|nr:hypothetical protein [uncultured Thiodictyon sp.]
MTKPIDVLRVLCCLALGSVAATPAAAAVRVAGGPPTGEFITFARATCAALGSLFSCNALVTQGSQDNLERLMLPLTDPLAVDFAFVQGNLADQFQQQPGSHERFVLVRTIAREAVLMIMTPETAQAVKDWEGVNKSPFLLSMGLPGEKSGDTAAFRALQAIPCSPLKGLDVKQYQGRPEMIEAVRSGAVRIGWLVQYPNPDNDAFKLIADKGLVVMGVVLKKTIADPCPVVIGGVDPDLEKLGGLFEVKDVAAAPTCWLWFCWPAQPISTTTIKPAILARASTTYPDAHSQGIQNSAIHAIQQAQEQDLLPKPSWSTALITFLRRIFG